MPITVTCSCGQRLAAKEEHAGKQLKCPKCQAPIVVPHAPSTHATQKTATQRAAPVVCPHCGSKFAVDNPALIGQRIPCPTCRTPFEVPSPHLHSAVTTDAPVDLLGSLTGDEMIAVGNSQIPGASSCPNCGSVVGVNAVLCVSCGTDLKTQQRIATESTLGSLNAEGTNVSVERVSGAGMQLRVGGRSYNLQGYSSVWFVQKADDQSPYIVAILILLLCAGVVPGILFWYLFFNVDKAKVTYRVELRGKGNRKQTVFRGPERSKRSAESIAKMISKAANLPYETQLGTLE